MYALCTWEALDLIRENLLITYSDGAADERVVGNKQEDLSKSTYYG